MLTVQHISKTYASDTGDVSAVKDVSFQVKDGEIYGLIGLSGAGKSTLIRCLNLLERPDAGSILFDGRDLTKLSAKELREQRREIAMIFQHFNLFQQKTVRDNIAFPLRLAHWQKKDIDRRVKELLAFVELEDKELAYPAQLSGGQKQRVAIARSLAISPKLILSDEGTSALDPETTQSILKLMNRTVREFGISAVLITHQMEVAKSICDRIAVMEDGRIVEENTVEQLFLHPKHPRTRKFIGTVSESWQQTEPQENKRRFQGPLYRLAFQNDSVAQPIISQVSRKFDIDVNLIAGSIDEVQTSEIGYLTVELLGEQEKIDAAIAWLPRASVVVEEIT